MKNGIEKKSETIRETKDNMKTTNVASGMDKAPEATGRNFF